MDDNFHKTANISDKITVLGLVEHIRDHALKGAGVKMDDKEAEAFFQTAASMAQEFRRKYMKKHFPDCPEELWCLGKAVEAARQRVYEADEGDSEDINEIDSLWQFIWERITGEDLSACSACREDKGEDYEASEMIVEEANEEFLGKPLGPNESFALYVGEYNGGVNTRVLYRVSVDKVGTVDHLEHWAVTVYEAGGNLLTMFHYASVEDIKDNWMFKRYPKKYKREFSTVI